MYTKTNCGTSCIIYCKSYTLFEVETDFTTKCDQNNKLLKMIDTI